MSAPTIIPFPWKVGDQAAIVRETAEKTLLAPTTIRHVGRVWVTTVSGAKYNIETGRPQASEYGHNTTLMRIEEARPFVERCRLRDKMLKLMSLQGWHHQLTAKQMRTIIEAIRPNAASAIPPPLNMHGEPFDPDMGHVPGSSTP